MATRWSRSAVTQQAAGAFLVIQWARWLAPVGRMTAVVRAKDPVAMAVVGGEEEETTPSMMVAVMVTKLEARARMTELGGAARDRMVESSAWGCWEAAVAATEAAMATVMVVILAMVEDVETRIHQAVVARVMEGVETAVEVKEAVAKAVEVEEAVVKASVVKGMVTAVERGGVEAEPRAVAAPTVAT